METPVVVLTESELDEVRGGGDIGCICTLTPDGSCAICQG